MKIIGYHRCHTTRLAGCARISISVFSSAETAFSTVNRVRLRTLAEDHKGAIRVLAILEQYGKMLSAILIGNNIVNLSASS